MTQYQGERFAERSLIVDSNDYQDCAFDRCELVYQGTAMFSLEHCTFEQCTWRFAGSADLTLRALGGLYEVGFTELIDATFEMLRGRAPASEATIAYGHEGRPF